jgi:dTDP-glucose 4,6-dehydratase
VAATLVTGADGFIGSHLVEALLREGHRVRALSQYNSLNSWGWLDHIDDTYAQELQVLTGDIRDSEFVSNLVEGCDRVFHLAALIAIPYSYQAPESYVDTNIRGTLNVLQACRRHQVQHLVHTSTSEVYGTAQYVPIDEEHPLVGQSPYSATKIGADQLAVSFFSSFDLPVSIIRPFNTFGPRQSARAVIPTVISQLLTSDHVSLGALTPTRDFSYVDDTVGGFIACMTTLGGVGKVTNLGSGYEISIGQTVELIAKLMGKELQTRDDPDRHRPSGSEVERLWSDNRKAKERFGWSPQFSGPEGFEAGLAKTIEWFSNPSHISMYKSKIFNV